MILDLRGEEGRVNHFGSWNFDWKLESRSGEIDRKLEDCDLNSVHSFEVDQP